MAKEIKFSIKLNVDGKEQLVTATSNLREMQRSITSVNSVAGEFRNAFTLFNQGTEAINTVTGALNTFTAETREFGAAMNVTNTMAGKSGEDLARMKDQITELGKSIPMTREALANGLYQVISNGVPEDNWLEFLNKSARSSVGGVADLGEVVKVTSTVIKNYGLSWDAAGSIQDKIQLTAKNGVTSFEQMAQALPRVASNAATLGVGIDELMASFATLTGVSGNTAEVSTQLGAVFTALIKPSSEASKMAQEMGIEFNAAAIKSAGGFQSFLSELDKSVKSYAQTSGMLEQEIYGRLFGSAESLRALGPLTGKLAETYAKNVENMKNSTGTIDESFGMVASSGSAKLQMLKNGIVGVADAISSVLGPAMPVLNFLGQTGNSVLGLIAMKDAFQKLSIAQRVVSGSTMAMNAASVIWNATSVRMNALTQVLSATFRGTAVSATTLKLAIQGLLISTGVGVAIVALTTVIGELTMRADDAADSMDGLSEAEQKAKEAHEQEARQIGEVRSAMALNIAKLKEFKGSKNDEKKIVDEMNRTYGEAMGYYSTVGQWYEALTGNSKAYCDQMIAEIRLRTLANKVAENQEKQHDIIYNKDGSRKKYSKGSKLKDSPGYGVGLGALDLAQRALDGLKKEENALKKEMESITGGNQKYKKFKGYSPTAPKGTVIPQESSSGKKKGKGKGKASGKQGSSSKQDKKAVPESVEWYTDRLSDLHEKILSTADEAQATALQTEYDRIEKLLEKKRQRIGLSKADTPSAPTDKNHGEGYTDETDYKRKSFSNAQQRATQVQQDFDIGIIGADEAKRQIEQIRGELQELGLKSTTISIDTSDTDKAKQKMQGAISAVQTMGSSLSGLGNEIGVPELNIAGTLAQAVATMTEGYATATTQASTLGPWAWIAFAATGLAQLTSMIAAVKQANTFATGGIIGGTSTSGDRKFARVNSGEMILNKWQQGRLFGMINTPRFQPPVFTERSIPRVNTAASIAADVMPPTTVVNVVANVKARRMLEIVTEEKRVAAKSGRRY